jgi:hypothetical protein
MQMNALFGLMQRGNKLDADTAIHLLQGCSLGADQSYMTNVPQSS